MTTDGKQPVDDPAELERLRRRFVTLTTLTKKWIRRIAVEPESGSTNELAERFLAGRAELRYHHDCAGRSTYPALVKETRAIRTMTANLLEPLRDAGRMDELAQAQRVYALVEEALENWRRHDARNPPTARATRHGTAFS
jgi:hypothetical protein